MAQNPFGHITPGRPMDGIPAVVWNRLLDLINGRLDAVGGKRPRTSTEPGVLNNTGSPLASRFQILQVGKPVPTQAQNDSEFAESRVLNGTTPAAGMPFAVLTEPATAGEVTRATLLGITPVLVNLTDTAHTYADCTTLTTKLTSAATGPARILWVATDETTRATGDQWAVVNLLGQSAGSGMGGLAERGFLGGTVTVTAGTPANVTASGDITGSAGLYICFLNLMTQWVSGAGGTLTGGLFTLSGTAASGGATELDTYNLFLGVVAPTLTGVINTSHTLAFEFTDNWSLQLRAAYGIGGAGTANVLHSAGGYGRASWHIIRIG